MLTTLGNLTRVLLFLVLFFHDFTMILFPEVMNPNESLFQERIGHVEPRCCHSSVLKYCHYLRNLLSVLAIIMGVFLYQQKDERRFQVSICLIFSRESLECDQLLLDSNSSFSHPSSLLKCSSMLGDQDCLWYDVFHL